MRQHYPYINFSDLLNSLAEIANPKKAFGFPPTDIIKLTDTQYQIQVALAGYRNENVTVTFEPCGARSHEGLLVGDRNLLRIEGNFPKPEGDSGVVTYIQRNIARRNFKHAIALDRHIEVESAKLEHGLLTIDLKLVVPDEHKPQTIKIN